MFIYHSIIMKIILSFLIFNFALGYEGENLDISSMNIEHSFTTNEELVWTHKSTLNIRSINSNSIQLSNENSLTNNEKENIQKSLKSNGFYKIRIAGTNSEFIETSLKTCQLISSNFIVNLQVSVDGFGNVVGLFLSTKSQNCHEDFDVESSVEIKTTAHLQSPVIGVSPNISDYLKRLEIQEREKMKSEQGDNKSFLSKYWFYLLPIVIMLLMTSMPQDAAAR